MWKSLKRCGTAALVTINDSELPQVGSLNPTRESEAGARAHGASSFSDVRVSSVGAYYAQQILFHLQHGDQAVSTTPPALYCILKTSKYVGQLGFQDVGTNVA
ncbi:MAG: hypothetical protein O7D29_01085, partial [Gemmatimonadetes bacterium]|nr:hypothetical protein [Gemmatimonadota bacterium]